MEDFTDGLKTEAKVGAAALLKEDRFVWTTLPKGATLKWWQQSGKKMLEIKEKVRQ